MVKQVLHHRVAKQHKVRQQPMFCLPSMRSSLYKYRTVRNNIYRHSVALPAAEVED